MTGPDKNSRQTRALQPSIVNDRAGREALEVKNHLKQYDLAMKLILDALKAGVFKLRPSVVLALHRDAYAGLSNFAGAYRPGAVLIVGAKFNPPPPESIPELLEEMCDYVNEHWYHATPIHLAAYVMWRLNWIHPFEEGNGSTARMLSYVVLSIRWGGVLPGTPTIPEQIVANRKAYFDALEHSDQTWAKGKVDVSLMEALIASLLSKQLAEFDKSTGATLSD
jgi:Fic family protein